MVIHIHNRGSNPPRLYFLEWRKKKGLTQEQVAARLDSDKGSISMMERGKKRATDKKIFAFAEALGISPEQLFRHPDAPTIDDLLRDTSAETREHIRGLVAVLARTGTSDK